MGKSLQNPRNMSPSAPPAHPLSPRFLSLDSRGQGQDDKAAPCTPLLLAGGGLPPLPTPTTRPHSRGRRPWRSAAPLPVSHSAPPTGPGAVASPERGRPGGRPPVPSSPQLLDPPPAAAAAPLAAEWGGERTGICPCGLRPVPPLPPVSNQRVLA